MMQVFALVDYDNVKPEQKEKAKVDVEENVFRIAQRASVAARELFPGVKDLSLRLYGGWTDKANNNTASGNWIYGAAGKVRGRHNGVRVTPEIAVNNYDCGLPQFVGLYRDGGQKMVDTLIVSDLITFCSNFDCPVILLSEDDDMIPGIVASRSARRNMALLRNRPLGAGMNDHVVGSLNIQIAGGVV